MSNLINELNNVVSMTSLEIAELTGKRHDNVMRDCVNILEVAALKSEVGEISYKDANNQDRKAYQLTKKATFVLVAGYSPELRLRCFERLEFLESQVKQLEDQKTRSAVQSANRRGVTWGDYCKANGLPAQKLMGILKAERKLFRVSAISGAWSVNPAFRDYFMVIKESNRKFNPTGINIRFNAKGREFFSKPENVQKFRDKLTMRYGSDTDKQLMLKRQAQESKGGESV
ncbi:Rha family transcriptional regulator [Tatumella sp. JGM130]|uniref:Rha family transcriptional regulator n=1 Tax=Tatumella sp. JGM130 TaxID=2799797 RepID=UPI001BB018CD|nr:Rha family transcriptional regulator [Tatumella sp. JGM130]MBS0894052.1 Rha family transcriptional regulator [Tatumella sp. JGM130]